MSTLGRYESLFDAGLFQELTAKHPGTDVERIADSVLTRHASKPFRSASAVLRVAVRKAVEGGRHRRGAAPRVDRSAVIRKFWAVFLDSQVAKDGHVPGFGVWYDQAEPYLRHRAEVYAESCWRKCDRDQRDPDECVAAGVNALRRELRFQTPPVSDDSRPEYAAFRWSLIGSIRKHGWQPYQVAEMLCSAVTEFPEIDPREIAALQEMGAVWDLGILKAHR